VRRAAAAIGRHALHAWRIAFAHPRTGKPLRFEAPLPADLEAGLVILRRAARLAGRARPGSGASR
jgi:23S rRNA pseudouridine1911/1915/1917 synthase